MSTKKRREIVKFYRSERTDDDIGGGTFNEVEYNSAVCYVNEIKPSDELILSQEQWTTTIKIECRYNPEKPVSVGDILKWRNLEFTVLKPVPDRIARKMIIIATARAFSTQRTGEPLPVPEDYPNDLQSSLQTSL